MTDSVRDAKLVQYLSEAYGKEKELETALQAHIGMTTRRPYKKRLQDHLKETKRHAREVERRIKKISGSGPSITAMVPAQAAQVVGRVKALAEGPVDMVRGGTSESEGMLKNAKKEYFNEHEEIANYTAIEVLAESLGDKDTAKLAREIRREEERMAKFLATQIPALTKAVIKEEIPAAERRAAGSSSGRSRSTSSRRRASSSSKSGGSSTRSRAAKSGSSKSSSSGSAASRSRSTTARSGSSRASSTTKARSSSKRSSSKPASRKSSSRTSR